MGTNLKYHLDHTSLAAQILTLQFVNIPKTTF